MACQVGEAEQRIREKWVEVSLKQTNFGVNTQLTEIIDAHKRETLASPSWNPVNASENWQKLQVSSANISPQKTDKNVKKY